jgi:hypothetical protein
VDVSSKIDKILNDLDAGGDFDVKWSAREGNRVFLFYEDGSKVVVEARPGRMDVTALPSESQTGPS